MQFYKQVGGKQLWIPDAGREATLNLLKVYSQMQF